MADRQGNMSRTEVQASQARLAEHRRIMQHTKTERTPVTSSPAGPGQFQNAPQLRKGFEQSHDARKPDPVKVAATQQKGKETHQPAAAMNGPKGPESTRQSADWNAHQQKRVALARAAKTRQEQGKDGKMKDGKDHD
jgi:hypothetical protein